jgi:superfamily II DNA or RNA helicase
VLHERPLRPYQAEAVAAIERDWERHRSTLLVLATGLGKTRTAAEVARRARARGRVLWLAHREELLQQAAEAMRSNAGLSTELERAESKAVVHELMGGADVVVASVATMHAARLKRWPADSFGTVIVDEAHHATARGYLGVLEHFSSAKVLGLTATPDRSDKIGLHNVFESCAFQFGILDGIRGGFLSPIIAHKVICGDLDLSAVKTTAGDLNSGDLERAMQVEGVIHQIAAPLVAEAGKRQTIAFCPTVAIAEELARVLAGYVGAHKVASISGATDRDRRKEILDAYTRGDIQFITNCAVLTEGFDAPATSCVAMCRPTKSRSLYTQCVGRGLRLAEGKANCLLLDFIAKNQAPDLVGPTDVLAGEDLDPDARAIAERKLTTGGAAEELTEAIEAARDEAAKRQRQLERERRAAHISALAKWAKQEMDVFPGHAALAEHAAEVIKPARRDERVATEAQREMLAKYGITLPSEASARSASKVIDEAMRRGLASMKQLRTIARAGLRTEGISKREASFIIDALANNGWQPTPELRIRYGRVAS